MKKIFLFDLDSTVTREEILPTIAGELGKGDEMRLLTESTMMGEIPFRESLLARVEMLKETSVSKMASRVVKIGLNKEIVKFIKENRDNCYIVTSNLDVWIEDLMKKIGINGHVFCSKAKTCDDKIVKVDEIFLKENAVRSFGEAKVIAVGDGSNDDDLIKLADVGVAFGGVRSVAPVLYEVCDYAVYDEDVLVELLNEIKEGK